MVGRMTLLALGASCIATAAPAATIVQYDSEQGGSRGFAGFDAALGTLQSVTLQIALSKSRVWQINTPATQAVTTSVNWNVNGNWQLGSSVAALNGTLVPLTGTGTSNVVLDRIDEGRAFGYFTVTATGGTTLTLDPTLFVGRAPRFNGFDLGHNGNAGDTTFTNLAALPAGTNLFQLGGSCVVTASGNPSGRDGEDNCGTANYTLTYTYAAVPEPATWGMMLAGFAVTGAAVRRRRRDAAVA